MIAATLEETPRGHIVCRVCGRIAQVPLDALSEVLLLQIAERYPEGWTADHVTLSLTGACRSCREGHAP